MTCDKWNKVVITVLFSLLLLFVCFKRQVIVVMTTLMRTPTTHCHKNELVICVAKTE